MRAWLAAWLCGSAFASECIGHECADPGICVDDAIDKALECVSECLCMMGQPAPPEGCGGVCVFTGARCHVSGDGCPMYITGGVCKRVGADVPDFDAPAEDQPF